MTLYALKPEPTVGWATLAHGRIARRWRAVLALCVACGALTATSTSAQGAPPPAGARATAGQQRPSSRMNAEQRAEMERRVTDRINEVIRTRLALDDDRFDKLRELATRIEDDRRVLRNEEVTTRFALRQELLAGDRVNETRVGELLDKMPVLERRRVDLLEREQRELAKFLTPSQRARYFALQDELRRGMQEMQRRRMGLDGPQSDTAGPPRRGGGRGRPPGA